MHRIIKLLLASILIVNSSSAQQKWNLKTCIEYAMQNNLSVKQTAVQEKVALINYKQSKLSQLPNASFSNNDGYRFGKSQNPSTGILENQNFFSIGLNFQSSVDIFNWYSKKNTILANQWEGMAAVAATQKLRDDIALSVANAYLQILLAKEQQSIAEVQLQQSRTQFDIVSKQVRAGALPELNGFELEAQVARDSANVITAKGNVTQATYILKSYMSIDPGQAFEIEEPPVEKIPVDNIIDLQPDAVYALAIANLPQQKMNDFKLKAAQKNMLAFKGALYPTISLFGTLSTNYGYFRSPVYDQVFSQYVSSGLVVDNGSGGFTDVLRPTYITGNRTGYITADPFGTQLSNNFGQAVGINISVPIFNGWSAKANYERSKLNITTLDLQKQQDNLKLKQDIYQAYNAALVALEKFNASKKSVDAAQKSYEFSLKRFNVGMLSTLELTTNENNLFTAKLQYVLNQFDYVFKMKVLEFYKGQGLKL
jgi:outer membrane protein